MPQFVNIDRFCAIEDTFCSKQLQFNGSWTFFFAYPSNPRMQSFTKELVNELEARGVSGVRWEDIGSNDLIFSKVCDGIHSNSFLLAEITEPNSNVLLEIGYALAVGRQPLLLIDQNRVNWKRELLTTLESCFYFTRQDIHNHIAQWQMSKPHDNHEPNQRLPFLEKMGIFDNQETGGTAYHLKPKISTDWISRVDKSFNTKRHFKLISMDPSDSVSDEFFSQARTIQRSSLIVASFVSKEYHDWEQNNASVALLTGFSIGLGKPVLVLQEGPAAPLLDLGSVSRPFETENEVQGIVEDWIEKQFIITLDQTIESRRQASSRQQAELIRSIYLGHPDALQDNDLLNYFVHTKEFEDAAYGRRTIFMGRKGSGKSANFRAIKAEITSQPNTINVEILPDDFQLETITHFLEHAPDLPDPRFTFQSIWNYVLTTEMLKSLAEGTNRLYSTSDLVTKNSLLLTYNDEYDNLALDFGSRVVFALKKVISSRDDLIDEVGRHIADEDLKSLRNYELERQLKKFAENEKITFFIVTDDLDKHWRANSAQSIDLLVGLIAEVARMQRFFGNFLKIVLFLREEIYDALPQSDDDFYKRDILRMEWTSSNLHHLVAVRLAAKVGEQNDEDVWSAVFSEPVKNMSASKYILTRTLPRPRDVLGFCQNAIDHAQRNGHSFVTEQDILDGEKSFSGSLLSSVSSEFKSLYPNLEDILIEFAGATEKISWNDFENIADKIIQEHREIMEKWIDGKNITTRFLAEVLFRTGLIGLSRNWTSLIYFRSQRSFSEIWRLASSNPIVHIHPAFTQGLEIMKAEPHPPSSVQQE